MVHTFGTGAPWLQFFLAGMAGDPNPGPLCAHTHIGKARYRHEGHVGAVPSARGRHPGRGPRPAFLRHHWYCLFHKGTASFLQTINVPLYGTMKGLLSILRTTRSSPQSLSVSSPPSSSTTSSEMFLAIFQTSTLTSLQSLTKG